MANVTIKLNTSGVRQFLRSDMLPICEEHGKRIKNMCGDGYEMNTAVGRKGKLFRSLNQNIKFGVIVDQHRVFDKIYESKKTKQRNLDFAYKVGLKGALSDLIKSKTIVAKEVEHVHVYVDEHTTATDGRYELQEGLLNEFKYGTYNWNYTCFFEPLFPAMKSLTVDFCNSAKNPLIRAADIVANRMYYSATRGKTTEDFNNLFLTRLP